MEPITHFLTGACIGRAGLNRTTGYATLMVTLAAEFPDVDVLWSFDGPVRAMATHRGLTHSFIGAPVDSAIVLGFIYAFHCWRVNRGKSPLLAPRWGLLFLFGILAVFSHILLDFTNNYGVRPFLPFNWHWYSWDIVFILEPVMLGALLLGLLVPAIFGLVSGEIGARREMFRGRWSAVCALLVVCAMWWVRDYHHRKAITLLNSADYQGEVVRKTAAMPFAVNPFTWAGIIETENYYAKIPVDLNATTVDPLAHAKILYKPAETPASLAAKRSRLGRVYLDWARFPYVENQHLPPPEQGYDVRFRDLRFDYIGVQIPGQPRGRPPLSADVFLDEQLRVVLMRMGNRGEKP